MGSADASLASPPSASAGSPGQPGDDGQPQLLAFEAVPGVDELAARTQLQLKVRALPAKVYHLRFALPTSGGDPLDAVLDQAEADTGPDGIATVQLTAPSSPTTFDVRASAGTRSASVSVTVKDTGFATLQVRPLYPDFRRIITTWVASAYPDKSCAELSGIPPEDGPIQSLPAGAEAAPLLNHVPAGTRLAVTLRSGHFVGGCTSVEKVAPAPADEPQIVKVNVLYRPIDLGASPLTVTFGANVPNNSWSSLLETSGGAVLQGLQGTSTDDVDALLDAMREASGSSRQIFETTRQAEAWDDVLRSHWGGSAATKLRDTVAVWLAAGRQKFSLSDHLFTGTLTPISQPADPLDQRSADFRLLQVAGLDGVRSGFVDRAQVSWSAGSDDTLHIGTDLYLVQSRLAEALAESAALEGVDEADATSAAGLLAKTLDCAGFADALAAAGPSAELAYDACDSACLMSLCEAGIAAIWRRGGDATGLSPARLRITATGAARVGDLAEVVGVSGSWLGSLTTADGESTTSGVLTAIAPAVP